MAQSLFSKHAEKIKSTPLADRMRPHALDEFEGQKHLIQNNKLLRSAIENDRVPSMILWGPPGSGKTTLAKIIAHVTNASFISFSAVSTGLPALKKTLQKVNDNLELKGKQSILFIDEIHRWNKLQQDALLPYVEDGSITLIGATTENPSFEVNSALLSRVRVFTLKELTPDELVTIMKRALKKKNGLGWFKNTVPASSLKLLSYLSNGDARVALNALELAVTEADNRDVTDENIRESIQKTHLRYDKDGEEHYNIISALHKSIRGSDVNAALYWLFRMIEGGEEPLYIARRLIRQASEDVGLADPEALHQAVSAYQACHFIGLPECGVNLAQAVVYLTKAPKSNTLYSSYKAVKADIERLPSYPVPLHLRNAPTKLMKEEGYGRGYKYTPDHSDNPHQEYLPKEIVGKVWWKGVRHEQSSK